MFLIIKLEYDQSSLKNQGIKSLKFLKDFQIYEREKGFLLCYENLYL